MPSKRFRWAEFTLPSTLQLAPLLELLTEPVGCVLTSQRIELGLHEALVNAVRHGNAENPAKKLRVRRILTPNWLVWQVQDEGCGLPHQSRTATLPQALDALFEVLLAEPDADARAAAPVSYSHLTLPTKA